MFPFSGGWRAAVLWASPLIITAAVLAFIVLSLRGHKNIGSRSSTFVSMAVVWLLHAGYLLGPWLVASGHARVALGLMIPVGLLFFLGGALVAVATGIVADCLHHWLPTLLGLAAFALALVAYAGPVLALLA
jgi:hypothetical protein